MTQRTHITADPAPSIGDTIGRYHIIGVLGDGHLGRLYLAEQRGIGGTSQTVALRIIRPELARSPRFGPCFTEAASIAARSEHPNVVGIFEMGNADGQYFVSMEYVPGESLRSLLLKCAARDPLAPETAAYLVKQAAIAVQYLQARRAASRQPIHPVRDPIDASDVFVTYHGTVKWLGVGLRSLASERAGLEIEPASSLATDRDSTEVAIDADCYPVTDLGELLLTCLGGENPPLALGRRAVDAAELHSGASSPAISSQSPTAPGRIRADVPDALDRIVQRALWAAPRDRFPNVAALSSALDRYLFRSDARPTPKHLRHLMEQRFGSERASLQKQIARGRDVAAALARLGTPQHLVGGSRSAQAFARPRPRALWSTSHSVFAELSRASIAPPRPFERFRGLAHEESSRITSIPASHMSSSFVSAPFSLLPEVRMPSSFVNAPSLAAAELPPVRAPEARSSRLWLAGTGMAACAVLAIGLTLILAASSLRSPRAAAQDSPAPDRGGRVDVRSTPEGAVVFVDGDPTGLRTPVVLKGLALGRTIRLRVEKAGFTSEEREIPIVEGTVAPRPFELLPSDARVRFAGAPPDARIFVDDVPVAMAGGAPVNLSVGSHAVRVETTSALFFSSQVDIVAGEQTIHVDGERAIP
jgi:serine/threonine protein kinase